ncbi:MAG: CvpA family protein [Candidatus Neomarinimicrobiota bacterium]
MFNIITIVVIGIFTFLGLRNGLVKAALKLIGFGLAALAASRYYPIGGKLLASLFEVSEGVRNVAGVVIVFIMVYVFFELIAAMIKSLLRALKLTWLDRTGGLLFGFLEGLVLMFILVWVINVYPEFGFVGRLHKSSTAFNLLSRAERKTIRMFNLETDLSDLGKSMRKIVMLPETPDSESDGSGATPVITIP